MDRKLKVLIGYYFCIFIFTYSQIFILPSYEQYTLFLSITTSIILLIITFTVIYISSKYFLHQWSFHKIGWTRKKFSLSFLWTSMLLLPLSFASLLVGYIYSFDTLMIWWAIQVPQTVPNWLPLFGIIFWILNGVIVFSFWIAFPHSLLKEYPKRYVLPLISVFFIFLYTKPFLTGSFKIIDIIWLGIIFVYLYHKFENSLSLILSYVLIFEGPVLWCFGIIFGKFFLIILIYMRFIWCIIASIILLVIYLKIPKNNNPNNLNSIKT